MTGERSIGEVVRRLRRALDLTQRDLAQRVYCATGTIRRIESGDLRPSRELAAQLATALGVPDGDREAFLELARRRPGDAPLGGAAVERASTAEPLPVPLGAVLGRDHAVAAVGAVLRDVRLLTLTGPPGVGKTTLAVAAARALAGEYADGALWVPLADVAAEELVPAAVARASGLQLTPDGEAALPALVAALRGRRQLVVLDNVEHLPRLAGVVSALLAACPGLRVLATGRTALRAQAEHEFPVQPLAPAAAVDLFLARARATLPDLELDGDLEVVDAICRRLDGLPLAIELAARRLRLLGPRELLAALESGATAYAPGRRDAPARQATMEEAVQWSYQLLTPSAARVLDRLSVFTGGAATDAVASVCADPDLEGAGELADHNLVLVEPGPAGDRRLRMLQIVRAFAAARLRDRGEEAQVRDRHVAHAAELAGRGRLGLAGEDQPRWLLRLDADVVNLADACDWACRRGQAHQGADIVGDLWWFWWASGRWIEARALLDLLRAHRPVLDHARRARVDFAEAHLAFLTGDLGRARRIATGLARTAEAPLEAAYACCFLVALDTGPLSAIEEPLDRVRRAQGGEQHLGTLLSGCALVALARGRAEDAARWIDEATRVYAELRQPYGRGVVGNLAGDLARGQGDLPAAAAHYTSAITALRTALVRPDLPAALANLGDVRLAEGDIEAARPLLLEALTLQWRLGNRLGQARCLSSLASVEARDGDAFEAAVLLAAAAACFGGGHPMSTPTTVDVPMLAEELRARLGERDWAEASAQGHQDPENSVRRLIDG